MLYFVDRSNKSLHFNISLNTVHWKASYSTRAYQWTDRNEGVNARFHKPTYGRITDLNSSENILLRIRIYSKM